MFRAIRVTVWLFYVEGAAGGRGEADMVVSSGVTGGNALTVCAMLILRMAFCRASGGSGAGAETVQASCL
ncbi:hypothetical protein DSM101010T_07030 [Desulfovibrio subterraneus]|uniref:Uncharacterized protein n=1 Tax=Desulfovibrio subterraneus TaxID=2718620 RepID=A0A7J0BFM3_9BACT|nr:hypothetical protein DSM101010T_07030 [Desulfovibrio subterraneus]